MGAFWVWVSGKLVQAVSITAADKDTVSKDFFMAIIRLKISLIITKKIITKIYHTKPQPNKEISAPNPHIRCLFIQIKYAIVSTAPNMNTYRPHHHGFTPKMVVYWLHRLSSAEVSMLFTSNFWQNPCNSINFAYFGQNGRFITQKNMNGTIICTLIFLQIVCLTLKNTT